MNGPPYGTGFGPTGPKRPEGFDVPENPRLPCDRPVSLQSGDTAIPIESASRCPGAWGSTAVRFHLPDTGGDLMVKVLSKRCRGVTS